MKLRSCYVALASSSLLVAAALAHAECKIGKMVELAVTMSGLSPTVPVKVNGAEVRLIADSGAFYSVITAASAAELNLKLGQAPGQIRLVGIGGTSQTWVTTVKEFTLGTVSIPRVEFLVGGSEPGNGAVGYLGQNVLGLADVEYDIANGAIRLMRPSDCGNSMLAYWATSIPYSVIDIDRASPLSPHTGGTAYINGVKIRVLFDTGAATSMLSLRAAARAGVRPGGAGVVTAGLSRGIGQGTVNTWIAPFASFKIGDEEVRNTHLRLSDISLENAEMLIGADFFLSHRVYVSNSQHKLYFTYNGGPVFNLATNPVSAPALAPPSAVAAQPMEEAQAPGDASVDTAVDAATFSRRGAASAARRDFEHAIADFTRACELQPDNASYLYQRGLARWNNGQPAPAMDDLEQAIKLKPDYVDALVTRAQLRLSAGDRSGAGADLDAADRFAAKEADIRFVIASAYGRAGLLAPAIAEYDLWIPAHRQDTKLADALDGRCWARALEGHDLDKALDDCNAALRMRPNAARMLDGRGLVRLRLGQFDKSIADYDAALNQQPKDAWSLYGRGVDKIRKGMIDPGQADIDAAMALQPRVVEEAKHFGITP
jgi:tetratricopeptide (TPR) repeat protein